MKMRYRRTLNPFTTLPLHARCFLAEAAGGVDGDHPHNEGDVFDAKAFADTTSTTIANLQKELSASKRAQAADIKGLKDTVTALADSIKGLTNPQTGSDDDGGADTDTVDT